MAATKAPLPMPARDHTEQHAMLAIGGTMYCFAPRGWSYALVDGDAPKHRYLSDIVFGELIAFFNDGTPDCQGRKSALARRLTELSNHSVTRNMVRAWLHPDPKKRRQPSFDYGMLLLAAGNEAMATRTTTKTRTKPNARRKRTHRR